MKQRALFLCAVVFVLSLTLLASASDRMDHGTIAISSDYEFTVENGVCSGSGTFEDPYVIEGWAIDCGRQPLRHPDPRHDAPVHHPQRRDLRRVDGCDRAQLRPQREHRSLHLRRELGRRHAQLLDLRPHRRLHVRAEHGRPSLLLLGREPGPRLHVPRRTTRALGSTPPTGTSCGATSSRTLRWAST